MHIASAGADVEGLLGRDFANQMYLLYTLKLP